ncbi:hypothetical protein, partial [Sphingomonas bacterium]|uniref:hypothetical protein n=1 Tax=Sphingomonas bacterium TaxID=1895847 RepID=UPI0015756A3C
MGGRRVSVGGATLDAGSSRELTDAGWTLVFDADDAPLMLVDLRAGDRDHSDPLARVRRVAARGGAAVVAIVSRDHGPT